MFIENTKIKKAFRILFFLYLILLIWMLIFKYPWVYIKDILLNWSTDLVLEGMDKANLVPFTTIKLYWNYYGSADNSFQNLFGNILVFLPFGVFWEAGFGKKKDHIKVMGAGFIFITVIETMQLISNLGVFDVDDIMLNLLGVFFGSVCYRGINKILKKGLASNENLETE